MMKGITRWRNYISYLSIIGFLNILSITTASSVPIVDVTKDQFDPYDLHPKSIEIPSFRYESSSQKGLNEESIDSDLWWEVKYTNHPVFNRIRKYKLFLRKAEIDVNMIHSCYEYKLVMPLADGEIFLESSSFCYPSIIITGVPKCSTSAMFALLSSPPFISSNPIKENCLFLSGSSILEYFASLPKSISPNHFYIDGCIDVVGNIALRKILRNPNTFYIVLVRNFADMIWSAYNYWCDPKIESNCDPDNKWAEKEFHKRSPELFHDILISDIYNNASADMVIPRRVTTPCQLASNVYTRYIDFVWEHVPKEATIIIASEELERYPNRIWKRLVSLIGIPSYPEPNFSSFSKVRYNTQTQLERGADFTIEIESYTPGKYSISDHRPLFPETVKLLNKCWHDDCKAVSKYTRFQYNACKDEPTFQHSSTALVSSDAPIITLTTESGKLDQRQLRIGGYLKTNLRKCFQSYAGDIRDIRVTELFLNSSTSPLMMEAESLRVLRDSISFDRPKFLEALGEKPQAIYSNQILLISEKQDDIDYMRSLFRFAFSEDIVYDTMEWSNHRYSVRDCKSSLIIAAPKHFINRVAYTRPMYGKTIWYQLNQSNHTCGNRYFGRLIVTRKEVLSEVWEYFINNHATKTKEDGSPAFDNSISQWNLWDELSITIFDKPEFNPTATSMTDDFYNNVLKTDFIDLVPSQLISGSLKFQLLRQLLKFIVDVPNPSSSKDVKNDLPLVTTYQAIKSMQPYTNDTSISCAISLTKVLFLDMRKYFHGRLYLLHAYSSKGLLCHIKQLFSMNNRLRFISFPRIFTCLPKHDNSTRLQVRSSNAEKTALALDNDATFIDVWKCDSRYHRRHFIEKIRHHTTSFIAAPGEGHVRTRQLYEYATGYYTGSVESNNSLLSIFGGEFVCGQRMGMIHVRSSSATIGLTRGVTPAVRLPLQGRRKCLKGMIRGFTRMILLVKDPFVTIWETFLTMRNLTKDVLTPHSIDMQDWRLTAQGIARNFTLKQLNTERVFEYTRNIFNETNVFALTQEALIYSEDDSRHCVHSDCDIVSSNRQLQMNISTTHLSSSSHPRTLSGSSRLLSRSSVQWSNSANDNLDALSGRYRLLMEMIRFTGYQEYVTLPRLHCAFSFLNIDETLRELDTMIEHYMPKRDFSLICSIKKILFEGTLSGHILIHHIFEGIKC